MPNNSLPPAEKQASHNMRVALNLAEQGFHVFPCRSRDMSKGKAKTPVVKWRDASTDNLSTVQRWWSDFEDAAVGFDLGKSGLLVIDCDRHDIKADGVAAFGELMDANSFNPDTCPIVATPSGGSHFYFKLPEGKDHGNATGNLPDGIDVRGNGGYVIAPNTIMGNGIEYELSGDIKDAPLIPDWLWHIITAKKAVDMPEPASDCATAPVCSAPLKTSGANGNVLDGAGLGELEELLNAVPPDCGYQDWVNCLMAVHAATDGSQAGFNLVDRWSAGGGKKYDGSQALQKKWASFQKSGVNSQSLAIIAKRYGADLREIALKHNDLNRVSEEEIKRSGEIADRLWAKELERRNAVASKEQDAACQSIVHLGADTTFEYEPELVRDLIPQTGVGFLAGQSGAGKTFLAIDLMHRIAMGSSFAGHLVDRMGASLYVAYEGSGTIKGRVVGFRKENLENGTKDLPTYCVPRPPLLDGKNGFESLLAMGRETARTSARDFGLPLCAIFIDTVTASGAIAADKENDPASWQRYMDAMQVIAKELGCVVILIHHYGKDAGAGLRGSSAARAAGDFALAITGERNEITGDTENRKLALTKSRTGIEGPIGNVELVPIEICKRPDGSPVTTATLSITKPTKSGSAKKPAKNVSNGMKIFKQAFNHVFSDKMEERPAMGRPDYPLVSMVPISAVRDEFFVRYGSGEDDPNKRKDAARKNFGRQVSAAINHGFVVANIDDEEWIWTRSNE